MKIKKISLSNDLVSSTKESAIQTAIAYNKTYELLHKQLWRKGRCKTSNGTVNFNGKTCKAITKWNIKSPSKNQYNKDSYYDLGLNQLFVGQSPYKNYSGDPKNGIYHDECYIYPKSQEVEWIKSYDMFGWYIRDESDGAADDGGAVYVNNEKIINKFDSWGKILVDNVIIEDDFEINATEKLYQSTGELYREYLYKYVDNILTTITNAYNVETGELILTVTDTINTKNPTIPDNATETDEEGNIVRTVIKNTISLGMFVKIFLNDILLKKIKAYDSTKVDYLNLTEEKNIPKYMTVDFNESGLGNPIAIEDITDIDYAFPTLKNIAAEGDSTAVVYIAREILKSVEYAKIYFFADGTAIQLIPPYGYTVDLGSGDQQMFYTATLNAQIMYLPLVYTDTGDLVINKFDFIDNWDDMFGLYVHEDSYWYISAIRVVVFVASIAIGYFTAGGAASSSYKILGAMFGAIGGYGTVSGNKAFQLIGAVGGLGTAFTGIVENQIASNAIASGFTQEGANAIAKDMIMNMSFGEMFKVYASSAGMSNLVSMGNSMFSIYQTAITNEIKNTKATEEDEAKTKMTGMIEEEQQPFNDYVNKIMMIGSLK